MNRAFFWISGGLLMFAGLISNSVNAALWFVNDHQGSTLSHAFGGVAVLAIVGGALCWRRA